jgi:hypothetical protein
MVSERHVEIARSRRTHGALESGQVDASARWNNLTARECARRAIDIHLRGAVARRRARTPERR